MIGNKYIMTGYRLNYDTHWKAFMSLFELHNETGNVWSHLLGALLFVFMTYYVNANMHAPTPTIKEFD